MRDATEGTGADSRPAVPEDAYDQNSSNSQGGEVLSSATANQRLAAWQVGRFLNELLWTLGQAWVTRDQQRFGRAMQLVDELQLQVRALGGDPQTRGALLRLLRQERRKWEDSFRSFHHDDEIARLNGELEVENRTSMESLSLLQRRACEPIVEEFTSPIARLLACVRQLAPGGLYSLVEFGRFVDAGLRPGDQLDRMFLLEDGPPATVDLSNTTWLHSPLSDRGRLFPPAIRPEEDQTIDPRCVRELRLAWDESPVRDDWCPVDERHVHGVGMAAKEFVELVDAIVCRFLENPRQPLFSWDARTRELRIGSFVLRTVKGHAKTTAVLAAFEEQLWPYGVDTNELGFHSCDQRRHAINQLNKDLKAIRFRVYYRGSIVSWAWNIPPETS